MAPTHTFCSICSPTFSGNKATKGATFGPDCYCISPKLCVGCTCHKLPASAYGQYAPSYCP